jgi:hypothetical protein
VRQKQPTDGRPGAEAKPRRRRPRSFEDILDEYTAHTGWNDASRVTVLVDFLERAARDKTTVNRRTFISYLAARRREEEEMAEGLGTA